MIFDLVKHETALGELHKLTELFFGQLDSVTSFDKIRFPDWYKTVFGRSGLDAKLEELFQAYKKLTGEQQQEVMTAIRDTNRVADLCENNSGLKAVCLKKFPAAFQQPLKNLFIHFGKMHCIPQNLMIIFRLGWKILLINLLLKIKVLKYVRFVLWKVFIICRGNPDEK